MVIKNTLGRVFLPGVCAKSVDETNRAGRTQKTFILFQRSTFRSLKRLAKWRAKHEPILIWLRVKFALHLPLDHFEGLRKKIITNPIAATASQAHQSAQVDAQRQKQNQQAAKALPNQADGIAGKSSAAANQKTANNIQDVHKGTRATGPVQAQTQERREKPIHPLPILRSM